MTIVTQAGRLSDWLKGEVETPTFFSRGSGTLLSGAGVCKTGLVLGRIMVGAGASAAFAGNTGNGAMGAIAVGAGAKAGVYKLVFLEPAADAGRFAVEDPDGIIIGTGTVAVAFSAGGIGFTLADGGTDFIAGDGFNITVAAGSLKYVPFDPAGTTGAQVAAAIQIDNVIDATSADKPVTFIERQAVVSEQGLLWGAGVTTQNHKNAAYAQLKALAILVRAGA